MAHYLGLELATEHVRATVVDEGLDIVFSAAVEFDTDLPEFQTRGGLFTAPGEGVLSMQLSGALRCQISYVRPRSYQDFTRATGQPIDTRTRSYPPLPKIPRPHPRHARSRQHSEARCASPETRHCTLLQLPKQSRSVKATRRVDPYLARCPRSAFLASLFVGDWAPATEAEAVATGFLECGAWWLGRGVPSSAPSPPPRSRHYTLLPHPCTPKSYITVLASRNGDVPRALVRDMYTKSWAAFDRLVSVVPPGGAIGLDDKLFSFWLLQPEGPPFEHVKGIYRFETGVKVNEFRDLRANPRQHARMTSLLTSTPTPNRPTSLLATSLSTIFDPYTSSALPSRILALGAAAGFASVASITADVFGARVLVPRSVIQGELRGGGSGTSTPGLVVPGQQPQSQQQQQPAPDTRAALGAAYLASGALGLGVPVGTYGRSGLGASVLVEEDEEEKEDENGDMHERTNTNSTTATSLSLHLSLPPQQPPNAANPTTTSASVHALPTDESDALLGLAKVAEGDMDAFSAYAALIPEWCDWKGCSSGALSNGPSTHLKSKPSCLDLNTKHTYIQDKKIQISGSSTSIYSFLDDLHAFFRTSLV
ncbi:Actin-like ATPase protein [Rhizoctonia solani]|uniref:Actin-like ATPase protein n=1 Tax=Rhizoctonia solani TaxID=456999 RepID=A0A8H7IHC2_9AGAM|nr:Actin-like ATPase protein [Rhizoctonia solani]